MHIPDGLMSPEVLIIGWLVAIPAIALAIRRLNRGMDERLIPFMAVLAGGIFIAQMLNFPVGGGTTGHLIGAALAVILLGPEAAIVVITTILIIQCFVFGDGGITSLGLNLLNMAVIAPFIAWTTLRVFSGRFERVGVVIAAWLSVVIAALVAALELSLSYELSNGVYGIAANMAVPAMLGYHVLIGIGEATITAGVVLYLAKVSPGTLKFKHGLEGTTPVPAKGLARAASGLILAFSIGLVGFFAFSAAYGDGLEVTMERAGLNEIAPAFTGILSYGDNYVTALVAGIIGFAITAGVVLLYWRARERTNKKDSPQD
jgi:cobalt/nickel transport system permease protein